MANPQIKNSISLEDSVILFNKQYKDRSDQENKIILSLLESIPDIQPYMKCFENPQEFLIGLAKLFQVETLSKGQALCHAGELPHKFWILLKGDLRKYIPKPAMPQIEEQINVYSKNENNDLAGWDASAEDSSEEDMPSITTFFKPQEVPAEFNIDDQNSSKAKQQGGRVSQGKEAQYLEEIEIFKKFKMTNKYFTGDNNDFLFQMEKVLNPGDSLAGINKNVKKHYTSTLVAWDEVHLVCIPLKGFLKEFKEHDKNQNEKRAFLQQMFPELPKKMFLKLSASVHKKVLRRGDNLFNEGSDCSELYMIAKGEIMLSKALSNKGNQEASLKLKIVQGNTLIQIMSVTSTQLLGEEMILAYDKRIFSAVVKSNEAVLYYVTKSSLALLGKFSSQIISVFLQKSEQSLKTKLMKLFSTQNGLENMANTQTKTNDHGTKKEVKHILTLELPQEASLRPDQALALEGQEANIAFFENKSQRFNKLLKSKNSERVNSKLNEENSSRFINTKALLETKNYSISRLNAFSSREEAKLASKSGGRLISNSGDQQASAVSTVRELGTPDRNSTKAFTDNMQLEVSPKSRFNPLKSKQKSGNEVLVQDIVESYYKNNQTKQGLLGSSPLLISATTECSPNHSPSIYLDNFEKGKTKELNQVGALKLSIGPKQFEDYKKMNQMRRKFKSPSLSTEKNIEYSNNLRFKQQTDNVVSDYYISVNGFKKNLEEGKENMMSPMFDGQVNDKNMEAKNSEIEKKLNPFNRTSRNKMSRKESLGNFQNIFVSPENSPKRVREISDQEDRDRKKNNNSEEYSLRYKLPNLPAKLKIIRPKHNLLKPVVCSPKFSQNQQEMLGLPKVIN